MPDVYGTFERGDKESKNFIKYYLKGLYAVKVMRGGLKLYLKKGKDVQEYEIRNAPKEMGINDDETKIRRLKIPKKPGKMIFFTPKGAIDIFAYFRDEKKILIKYDEEEIPKKLDEMAPLI